MESDKAVESIRFLLSSVSKLSERFLDTNDSTQRSFDHVRQDIDDLIKRLGRIEADLVNWRDKTLLGDEISKQRSLDLPVKAEHEKLLIPPLNLPIEGIVDAYRITPALLQPFARPCSVSARTLNGTIVDVEIEVFAQGIGWMIETQDGEWLLLPRPGLLKRRSQYKSLERLFQLEAEPEVPAELELLKPGRARVIEHGRRWYLSDKGRLGVHSDPLQQSLENRLRRMEERLKILEPG